MDDTGAQGRLQRLVDDLDIRRVMHEYAARVDLRDWESLREVLADDLVVDYHNGRTVVSGGDEVVEYIRTNTAHLAWQHHHVTPYAITIDGDEASGLSYLLSHQVISEAPEHVVMMAATYECRFRRDHGSWLLTHMVHTIRFNNFIPVTAQPPTAAVIPPAVLP